MERWEDRNTSRTQVNNSVEAILRKSGVKGWLEDCGPTSATTGCDVLGYKVEIDLPGGAQIQGEDALSIWMNDPVNIDALKAAVPGVDPSAYMNNEILQYYPFALAKVFGAKAEVRLGQTFQNVADLVKEGNAVMIHLKNPRHYLCVVHFDEANAALIYRDPWPGRTGTDGFNLSMKADEWAANAQDSICVISKP